MDYKTRLNLMYAALGYELNRMFELVRTSSVPVELSIPGGLENSVVSERIPNPWDIPTRTYSTGLERAVSAQPKIAYAGFNPNIDSSKKGHHNTYHGGNTRIAKKLNENRARRKPARTVSIRKIGMDGSIGTVRGIPFKQHKHLLR
ncbi:MAG: hypothetical protein AABX00_03140 [Nanoarchaeota archaeon]